MYTSIHFQDGTFYVHMAQTGSKAVKGFTHGRVSFESAAKTVQFSSHPPIRMPQFEKTVAVGSIISFGLIDPEGNRDLGTLWEERRNIEIHHQLGFHRCRDLGDPWEERPKFLSFPIGKTEVVKIQ